MPNVNIELVKIGKQYTRDELAELWGYKSRNPLERGIVTPGGLKIIILFVTKIKQAGATPYIDRIDGNYLSMMGEEKHGADKRLLENLNVNNNDRIFLFYRELHHTPFTFYGRCYLIDARINDERPSEFEFLIEPYDSELGNEDDIMDYVAKFWSNDEKSGSFFVDGTKKIARHIRYERNPHNRREAIRIQGNKCKVCGFDFDIVYGKELADGYIEVHHIKQLAEGEQTVNPARDLLPVCANCHRMLHRKRKNNLSIEEIKQIERVTMYSGLLKRLLNQ